MKLFNNYTYWPISGKVVSGGLQKSPAARHMEGLQKGVRLHVVPLSITHGDEITAIGINSTFSGESFVELNEPFQGNLEDFDGETVRMRTDQYYNLKFSVADVKSIMELPSASENPL